MSGDESHARCLQLIAEIGRGIQSLDDRIQSLHARITELERVTSQFKHSVTVVNEPGYECVNAPAIPRALYSWQQK